jgi:NADH-quinone oxidoreductase subunit N
VQGLNERLTGITESFALVIPELILSAAILLILLAGLFKLKQNLLFNILTSIAVLLSISVIISGGLHTNEDLFNSMMRRDGFGEFLMILVDVSVILTCLMSIRQKEAKSISEYYALILSIALGGHLLLMSTNLVMVFLSLEIISISSYILAGYSFDKAGSEGSLKYFLFGSISSAIMLYGFSLLYGFAGTLDFESTQFFDGMANETSPLLMISGIMALAGFLFKIAAVPMQPWAPDVYEAAPMPVIAYLSVAPKLAALGVLAKFIMSLHVYGQGEYDWQILVAAIAILTITVGNLSALWQKNPKRMMAYSSIAHSGFLLVGIAAFVPEGLQFMVFYGAIYLLMNYCVFVYLMYFDWQGLTTMESFSGAGKNRSMPLVGLTVGLVALTGLPPTAGFTAKLFIFSPLWEAYQQTHKSLLIWLLIFGLLNTVISLFYYLRIPYFAFIKAGNAPQMQKNGGFENLLGLILVVLIVVIFFIPGLLMGLINRINFV